MARKEVQPGVFDLEDRYAALSEIGDALERLAGVIDFEPFRYRLEKVLKRSDGSKGGRLAYDCVMMFKIRVLQALYGLSDDQPEFMVGDRLSFMRFLGLGFEDGFPMPRRSRCSASCWSRPRRSTSCSRFDRRLETRASWRWAARSSMRLIRPAATMRVPNPHSD
jgi:hypothetical protein